MLSIIVSPLRAVQSREALLVIVIIVVIHIHIFTIYHTNCFGHDVDNGHEDDNDEYYK